jgi:DNA-binding transcriptional MerR regulator
MSTQIEPDAGDLTIQQVSRRTGLAESALRYYERPSWSRPSRA